MAAYHGLPWRCGRRTERPAAHSARGLHRLYLDPGKAAGRAWRGRGEGPCRNWCSATNGALRLMGSGSAGHAPHPRRPADAGNAASGNRPIAQHHPLPFAEAIGGSAAPQQPGHPDHLVPSPQSTAFWMDASVSCSAHRQQGKAAPDRHRLISATALRHPSDTPGPGRIRARWLEPAEGSLIRDDEQVPPHGP